MRHALQATWEQIQEFANLAMKNAQLVSSLLILALLASLLIYSLYMRILVRKLAQLM